MGWLFAVLFGIAMWQLWRERAALRDLRDQIDKLRRDLATHRQRTTQDERELRKLVETTDRSHQERLESLRRELGELLARSGSGQRPAEERVEPTPVPQRIESPAPEPAPVVEPAVERAVEPVVEAPTDAPRRVVQPEPVVAAPPPAPAPPTRASSFHPRPPAPPVAPVTVVPREPLERIVARWAPRVGSGLVVLGLAFLLSLYLRHAGPLAKVLFGALVSAGMIAAGVVLERRSAYRVIGRSLLAAGWAALYFTAFGAHSVDAMRVVESPFAGSILLGLVALGMVAHSLRYEAQWVTGGAVFLALVTVALSDVTTYALGASALLAVVIVVLARKFRWHGLALFGLLATYANHAWTTCVKMGDEGFGLRPENYPLALGFLVLYFALFAALELLMRHEEERDDELGLALFIGNLFGFLALAAPMTWVVHPTAMALLLGLTAVAVVALAAAERFLGRIVAHRLAGSVALLLAFAACSYHFKGPMVSVAWLLCAQAALLYGFVGKEPYFRGAGLVALLAPLVRLFGETQLPGEETVQLAANWTVHWHAIVGFGSGLLLFANSGLYRRIQSSDAFGMAGMLQRVLTWVAGAVLLFWTAQATDARYWGLCWLLLSIAWFEIGRTLRLPDLRALSFVSTVLSLGATGACVLTAERFDVMGLPGRPLLAGAVVAWAFVLDARLRTGKAKGGTDVEVVGGIVATALAGVILVPLLCLELRTMAIPLALMAVVVVLLEAGIRFDLLHYRIEAECIQVIAGIALAWCDWWGRGHGIPSLERALFGLPALALMMAVVERLRHVSRRGLVRADEGVGAPAVLSWLAAALLGLALYRKLPEEALPAAFAVVALVLRELPPPLRWLHYKLQSLGHVLVAVAWVFLVSLTSTGSVGPLTVRTLGALPCAAALYYLLWRNEVEVRRGALEPGVLDVGPGLSWLGAAVVASWMHFELDSGWPLVAWPALAALLLVAASRTGLASFRLQAFVLTALTVGRGIAIAPSLEGDVLGMPRRIVVMGLASLALFGCQALMLTLPFQPRRARLPGWLDDGLLAGALAIFGASMLAVLIFHEVSGKALTIAWALEGFSLFLAGLLFRQRVLRLLGIVLIGWCIVKVFGYDLRDVETLWRAVSLVLLGAFLIGIALLYARFRERLKDYL